MVSAPNERTRIGTALALGSKPKYFIIGHVDKVLTALIHCTRITAGQKEWAESRRDAILSIEKLVIELSASPLYLMTTFVSTQL